MYHAASNVLSHFILRALAENGIPAMRTNTRYANNEPALITERVALDLRTGILWIKEKLGFEQVVLLGFNGEGCLASFY